MKMPFICHLTCRKKQSLRKECACYLGNDIGAYNSCPHMCKYCYANYDEKMCALNRNKS